MLFAMTAANEVEGAAFDVRQIHCELNFSWYFRLMVRLIVPGIAMPAVKVSLRRNRLPSLGLSQLEFISEITVQYFLHDRMKREVDKSLVQRQNVLDHVSIRFGLFVTVKVIPAQSLQAQRKCTLHPAKLLGRQQVAQYHDPVLIELSRKLVHLIRRSKGRGFR